MLIHLTKIEKFLYSNALFDKSKIYAKTTMENRMHDFMTLIYWKIGYE